MTDNTDSPEQNEDDDLEIDSFSLMLGKRFGAHAAYLEVQEAWDNAGSEGVQAWLEYNRPKSMEDWRAYRERTDESALPWTIKKPEESGD